MTTSVVTDVDALEREWADWDSLAEAASRPYSAPGWAVSWWSRAAPPRSRLLLVAVRDGQGLVGLAPLFLQRDRWGVRTAQFLAGPSSSHCEPLAQTGREEQVAGEVSRVLAQEGVDVVRFSEVPEGSPWPDLLRRTWPARRPRLAPVSTVSAPYVEPPPGGPDAWFKSRSRNSRRRIREFERRGGHFRRAETPTEIAAGLADFARLHHGRWSERGGSRALEGGMADALGEAAVRLGPSRFQLWSAAVEDRTVATALFVVAGGQMNYWLGGFDDEWADLSPSVLLLTAVIGQASLSGCDRISLGPGEHAYKSRLASGDERLVSVDLIASGGRGGYVELSRMPTRVRLAVGDRLSPRTRQRIRERLGLRRRATATAAVPSGHPGDAVPGVRAGEGAEAPGGSG